MNTAGVQGAPLRTHAQCLTCGRKAVVHTTLGIKQVEKCDWCRKTDRATSSTFPTVEED